MSNNGSKEDTLPGKLKEAANEMAGQEDVKKDVPEKSRSFMEEVAEYSGRLYGNVKKTFSKGAETTGQETEKTRKTVATGWTGDSEKPKEGIEVTEEKVEKVDEGSEAINDKGSEAVKDEGPSKVDTTKEEVSKIKEDISQEMEKAGEEIKEGLELGKEELKQIKEEATTGWNKGVEKADSK